MMPRYIALVRGLNVGGSNQIGMPALQECFRGTGYTEVSTFLRSGNIVFAADGSDQARLESSIEQAIHERFGIATIAVVLSREELSVVIAEAPEGHGRPGTRSDAFFLKRPLTAEEAIAQVPELREGVDSISVGVGVLYFSRLATQAGRTRITRFMTLPIFRQITVRSWSTVTRLLDKIGEPTPAPARESRSTS